MFGLVEWTESREPRQGCGERAVAHLRFYRVSIRRQKWGWQERRRAAAAARQLRRMGVTRAVFPESFPWMEEFQKVGVAPVSPLPLYRALAADWVRVQLTSSVESTVAVAGDHLTGELVRAVTELSLRTRYVLLDLPYGGEELSRQLRREYGVSLQLRPEQERLEQAPVAVLFDPRPEWKTAAAVLRLYEGGAPEEWPRLCFPAAIEELLPQGCCRPQMAAALWETGVLRPGQVEIGGKTSGA